MTAEDAMNIGWIVILIMLFSILKSLFVMMYMSFINMRGKMKTMFSAEDEILDSPHTSDDNSDTIDSIDTDEIEEEVRREEYERDEYNEKIKVRQEERKSVPGAFDEFGNPHSPSKKEDMDSPYGVSNNSYMQSMSSMTKSYKKHVSQIPGQMVNEEEYYNEDDEGQVVVAPDGPGGGQQAYVEQPQSNQLRNNNFFEDQRPESADNHLEQLEQVANNDYG